MGGILVVAPVSLPFSASFSFSFVALGAADFTKLSNAPPPKRGAVGGVADVARAGVAVGASGCFGPPNNENGEVDAPVKPQSQRVTN